MTFIIESNSNNYRRDIENFSTVFRVFEGKNENEIDLNEKLSQLSFNFNKAGKQGLKINCPDTHFDGHNIWFLK